MDKQLVQDAGQSYWAFCTGYLDNQDSPKPASKGKIDYREVLNEQDFAVFARLRTLRKELADGEGIPAYAVLTNEQLAERVQRRVQSATALREIAGAGEAHAEKYGDALLRLLREAFAAPGATPPEPLTSVGFFMSHLRALIMIRYQGTWAARARVPGNCGR
ncbi:MAG: HRDC domain-containing protein [Albidovulum sp.]